MEFRRSCYDANRTIWPRNPLGFGTPSLTSVGGDDFVYMFAVV